MRVFLFDTETTDLIANSLVADVHKPHIIEFYGAIVDEAQDFAIVRELDFMCHPGFEIKPETTKITGITPEMLKGKPPFNHFEGQVRGIIGDAGAMVAHNLSYDWAVLQTEFDRCGTADKVQWPAIRICTVEETEWMKGYRLSLSALHEELFGEPFAGAHRAKVDVQAMIRCWVELRKRGDV